ncbi:hypothetical protein FACS189465_2910 [Clostridia bacterium]|nr:hypothetical protein FACS189465_2910 [Clostridia bacterium]
MQDKKALKTRNRGLTNEYKYGIIKSVNIDCLAVRPLYLGGLQ